MRDVPAWVATDAADMVERQRAIRREDLPMCEMSDFQFANAQFMVDRYDLELILYQTAAKERIRWLSVQLADAQAALSEAEAEGARKERERLATLAEEQGNRIARDNTTGCDAAADAAQACWVKAAWLRSQSTGG